MEIFHRHSNQLSVISSLQKNIALHEHCPTVRPIVGFQETLLGSWLSALRTSTWPGHLGPSPLSGPSLQTSQASGKETVGPSPS